MAPITTDVAHHTATTELDDLIASWRRHLTARRMSPATLSTYSTSVRQLARFLAERGMPTSPAALPREHVEAFVTDLLERWKPATAHNRYTGPQLVFCWLVDEGEIRTSPMDRMKPPRLPEVPPPVLRESELKRLLTVCRADKTFAGRRDEAILTVFMDTGCRRGELLGLTLGDVDMDAGALRVVGKGSRTRLVAIGPSTVRMVTRYAASTRQERALAAARSLSLVDRLEEPKR